jgi:hypothetical protein
MAEPAPTFSAKIRYFKPERASGLAVVDATDEVKQALGGLKQLRVHGRINGVPFVSSTMPGGGGRLCLSVSKQMMSSAGAAVGDSVTIEGLERETA